MQIDAVDATRLKTAIQFLNDVAPASASCFFSESEIIFLSPDDGIIVQGFACHAKPVAVMVAFIDRQVIANQAIILLTNQLIRDHESN